VGLGWLGLPLARHLQKVTNVNVAGSVRTSQKQAQIKQCGIDCDVFSLYDDIDDNKHKQMWEKFNDAHVVINIPPGRKDFKQKQFIRAMLALIDKIMSSGANKLIFVSTTSVYGIQTGIINESNDFAPASESAHAHIGIESYLRDNHANKSKVLRPAGLVGPAYLFDFNKQGYDYRHPINTLCHKTGIAKGRDPVNLVHQSDVIQAIISLFQKDTKKHAYNLSALDHPSRQQYYTWCAKQLNLPIPKFAEDTKTRQLGKLIDASSTYVDLGFTPAFKSVYDMLPSIIVKST
jgi:nucleoside-diphosphate-sugar epimerase